MMPKIIGNNNTNIEILKKIVITNETIQAEKSAFTILMHVRRTFEFNNRQKSIDHVL